MPQKITSKLKPLFSLLGILVVFLGFSSNSIAAYNLNYRDFTSGAFSLRVPYITDFEGQNIYNSSTLEGLHYELDYDLNGVFNSYNYYNAGYYLLDCYLYFYLGSNLNYTNLRNFSYVYTDDSPEFIYSNIDRCTVISLNDGFAFHFSLIIMFNNYYDRVSRSFSIGNIHFDFDIQSITSGSLDVQPFDKNNVAGFSFSSSNVDRNANPYNIDLARIIGVAINNATDIDSIISLLTAANTLNSNIFDELTYIYSTNQNIYTRLGLILEWLEAWSDQEDYALMEVLAELQGVISANNDIISELPSFSWEDYGNNISDLYYAWQNAIRPAAPSSRDNTLLWQWLGGRWVLYILGLVFILGTISFILYGKK